MRPWKVNALLLLGVVLLAVLPLVLVPGDFGGADGLAEPEIRANDPGFEPGASPLFEPPGEVESGLFALQAALGAGVLGYVLGVLRTRHRLAARDDAPTAG